MPIHELLDLKKAFRRVMSDKHDDTWPDVVGYRDYSLRLDENLGYLSSQLEHPGSYRASLPLGIDLPKKGFTLRPGVVPLIDDRTIYQATADFLSPHFRTEACVFSNQLSSPESSRMFLPGVDLWLGFQAEEERLCANFPFVVQTDITAYFEHISHDLLLHRIDDLFSSRVDRTTLREIKIILQRLWMRWNRSRNRFGIPQVNDASSFYANLYLDELDKWMLRHNYTFLRYVDDMRIFTRDEPSARRALAELITQLREMGLYVASAKTKILDTASVLEEMILGHQRMDAIETELRSRDPRRLQGAASLLEDFANELINSPEQFNDRHFRYCVNRFKKLRVNGLGAATHDRMVIEVLERLKAMPYSTDIFVDYLSLFPDHDVMQQSILEFLEGPYNIYPWQEMLLLELLIRCQIPIQFLERTTRLARSFALDNWQHPACRAKAYILWGKIGDYADRREIRARYHDEEREDVRRAILAAIQEMQIGERNHFYETVLVDSRAINYTTRYIQTLPRPTYHYFNPPRGFEVEEIEAFDISDDIDELSSEDFLY
ncbi:MAG: RNA-directed DNA polymerase [Chloroflexota bacterium]